MKQLLVVMLPMPIALVVKNMTGVLTYLWHRNGVHNDQYCAERYSDYNITTW